MLRRTLLAAGACAALIVSGCQTADVSATGNTEMSAAEDALPGAAALARGKASYMAGNYGLAEESFRQAAELRPNSAEAWMGLAASYDRLGRFGLADRAYEQLLRTAGRKPRVLNNMGYSQFLRGNREEARKLYREALASMPGDPVVEANVALLEGG